MNFIDFEKQLNQRAAQLSYEERITQGTEICKRLFPYYKSFANESGFGNPDVLLDSIRFVEAGEQDVDQIYEFLDNLEEVCPDAEEYEDAEYAEYALNACGAVNALLLQVAEPDEAEHFVEVALSYYETIEAVIQDEAEEEMTDEELEAHPLLVEASRFLLAS